MNKIKLTKDQARMLENHRNNFGTLMMKRHQSGVHTFLDNVSIEDIVTAFFDGYEIELTPEEKLDDAILEIESFINEATENTYAHTFNLGRLEGIRFTMETLDI